MERLHDNLVGICGAPAVLRDEPMSAHTTFRIGGPADFLVSPESIEQLRDCVALCKAEGAQWRILGHGSNILVADEGLRGVTIKLSGNLAAIEREASCVLSVQAGASNAKVAAFAQRAGLAGYEFAAGIPGSVGGAAIMNAGAYGGEFCQVATSVTCLDGRGELVELSAEQAGWGYRRSAMMDDGSVVVAAKVKLCEDDPDEIRSRMADLARRRQEKQPIELPSAGSTFKRPSGYYAGKLVQDAGMQGHAVGGAQVSTKHAGFVVNKGGASAADVLQVMRDVQAAVAAQFGVTLQPEVRLWGFDD